MSNPTATARSAILDVAQALKVAGKTREQADESLTVTVHADWIGLVDDVLDEVFRPPAADGGAVVSRLGRKRISRTGPGFAVIDADGVVLEGRWQTAEDAFEEGLLGVWLLSGMDVIKYDHCARCRQPIALDYDAATREPLEGAIWTTQAHGFDACTPGPNDEDRYHDPLHETPEEAS